MTRLLKIIAATTVLTAVGLGFSSLAGAVDVAPRSDGYPPQQCTVEKDGVQTVVPCDPGTEAEVLGLTQGSAGAVVAASGTLPYTGAQSTFPLVQVGVALLAGGGVVLLFVKNRRAETA
jgi:LPXTG-motif cell wall-anchored protein